MKVWSCALIFTVTSLAASAQTCPSDHFSAVFVATADETIDIPVVVAYDFELSFLKYILKLRDNAIQHVFEDAIIYFNDTFGLDFSPSAPNEKNQVYLDNAVMGPFRFSIYFYVTVNNWIRTGSTRSSCYKMHGGGITVIFAGNQTLYGSYGGTEGKPVKSGDLLLYGIFSIDACQQSPVLIQFQSNTPIRTEPIDGTFIVNFDLYNAVLGYGEAQGIMSLKPDPYEPDKYRAFSRTAFTFPA